MVMSDTLFPLKKKKKKAGQWSPGIPESRQGVIGEALNLIKG